jgi:hypothetical protein
MCQGCLEALPPCGEDCAAEVMTALGDCAPICADRACACDLAREVIAPLCAPQMSPFCGPLAEVVAQGCVAACNGDPCGQCAQQVDRAFLSCALDGGFNCEAIWEAEMGACVGVCGPQDECAFCADLVVGELAECQTPACDPLRAELLTRCEEVCAAPACADCNLTAVFATLECLQAETPAACLDALMAMAGCPESCEGDCVECGLQADMGYVLCRSEQPDAVCRPFQMEAWTACGCPPPPCAARIASAQEACFSEFGDACIEWMPFIDQICEP